MPRFAHAAPDSDIRKAIEQRARAAANPIVAEEKRRWPFPAPTTSAEPPTAETTAPQLEPAEAQTAPPQ
jgi:hypothetical protein